MIDPFIRRLILAGAPQGPLAGLTFAVKDNLDLAGVPTGAGSPHWERTHEVPRRTAPAVQRLLDAGATCVGKTHMDEMAFGLMGANEQYGMPLNPAAPDRVPGGSSSGSASAVAAGDVDFALGTDTGGSIRVPASNCGLFGLRPTHGAVPTDGCVPLAPQFDTVGLMTRDISILQRAAGTLLSESESGTGVPKRLLVPDDLFAAADGDVRSRTEEAVARIAQWFDVVEHIILAHGDLRHWRDTYLTLQFAGIRDVHASGPDPTAGSLPAVFGRIPSVFCVRRIQANDARERLARSLYDLLGEDGLLCFPTVPKPPLLRTAAPNEVRRYTARTLDFTCVAGLGGLPELTLPLPYDKDHPPVGISLLGPLGSDRTLLRVARELVDAGVLVGSPRSTC